MCTLPSIRVSPSETECLGVFNLTNGRPFHTSVSISVTLVVGSQGLGDPSCSRRILTSSLSVDPSPPVILQLQSCTASGAAWLFQPFWASDIVLFHCTLLLPISSSRKLLFLPVLLLPGGIIPTKTYNNSAACNVKSPNT